MSEKRDHPATVGEAVGRLLELLSPEDRADITKIRTEKELIGKTHASLSRWIRNTFGLWEDNDELLEDAGSNHPDDASGVILRELWKALRSDAVLVLSEDGDWPAGFEGMADKPQTPKVGVGVAAFRTVRGEGDFMATRKQVLMGLRKGSHGSGKWTLAGGHVDVGEDPLDTARRELLEETGLETGRIIPHGWGSSVMEGLHYVTLFTSTSVPQDAEPELREPHRYVEWRWFDVGDLPPEDELFHPAILVLRDLGVLR